MYSEYLLKQQFIKRYKLLKKDIERENYYKHNNLISNYTTHVTVRRFAEYEQIIFPNSVISFHEHRTDYAMYINVPNSIRLLKKNYENSHFVKQSKRLIKSFNAKYTYITNLINYYTFSITFFEKIYTKKYILINTLHKLNVNKSKDNNHIGTQTNNKNIFYFLNMTEIKILNIKIMPKKCDPCILKYIYFIKIDMYDPNANQICLLKHVHKLHIYYYNDCNNKHKYECKVLLHIKKLNCVYELFILTEYEYDFNHSFNKIGTINNLRLPNINCAFFDLSFLGTINTLTINDSNINYNNPNYCQKTKKSMCYDVYKNLKHLKYINILNLNTEFNNVNMLTHVKNLKLKSSEYLTNISLKNLHTLTIVNADNVFIAPKTTIKNYEYIKRKFINKCKHKTTMKLRLNYENDYKEYKPVFQNVVVIEKCYNLKIIKIEYFDFVKKFDKCKNIKLILGEKNEL